MTTTPTPASQPSPEYCSYCDNLGYAMCVHIEQPSPARSDTTTERVAYVADVASRENPKLDALKAKYPARSDKDAERPLLPVLDDDDEVAFPNDTGLAVIHADYYWKLRGCEDVCDALGVEDDKRVVVDRAGKAQESAPRSDKDAECALDSEVERVKFETWAAAYGLDCDYVQGKIGIKYLHDQANDAWEGWLGAKIDAWMEPAAKAQESAPSSDAAIWEAVTRLERQDSTYTERIAAADGLRALARSSTAGTTEAPSGDDLYVAWHKVGADVAGLNFADFIAAIDDRRATAGNAAPAPFREVLEGYGIWLDDDVETIYRAFVAGNAAPVKDHVLREVVNGLRDVAIKYHGSEQLRARLRSELDPLLASNAGAAPEDAEKLLASIAKWWEEHQYDTTSDGDGGEWNVFDDAPEFVKLAKELAAPSPNNSPVGAKEKS